jgi:hypothetical protein
MSSSSQSPLQNLAFGRADRLRSVQRLLPALLVLLFAVLAAPNARASVPMCSGDGRSIVAPPIMGPNRGLVLEAPRPCPKPDTTLTRAVPRDPGGQPTPPSDGPLRAVPVSAEDLPRLYLERRSGDHAARSTGLELGRSIERPPRR